MPTCWPERTASPIGVTIHVSSHGQRSWRINDSDITTLKRRTRAHETSVWNLRGDAPIDGDTPTNCLRGLAADGQLAAYRHDGFWHAMDTLRDRNYLESLWAEGRAPWKTWE